MQVATKQTLHVFASYVALTTVPIMHNSALPDVFISKQTNCDCSGAVLTCLTLSTGNCAVSLL